MIKIKSKNKKRIVILLIIYCCLVANFNIPKIALAESNYSNYLENESLGNEHDKAHIRQEIALSGNNYRNYYETNFMFPNKLKNDMYSTEFTSNPSTYYMSQYYLNNLDNDNAFKSVINNGQYESNTYIENYTDINYNVGNYINSTYGLYHNNSFCNIESMNLWKYIDGSYTDWYIGQSYSTFSYDFELNLESNQYINNISISIYSLNDMAISQLYYRYRENTELIYEYEIPTLSSNSYSNFTYNFDNYYNFNDLNFQFRTGLVSEYIQIDYIIFHFTVYNIINYDNQNLYTNDFNTYNLESNGSGINGLFPSEYSFTNDNDYDNPTDFTLIETGGSCNVFPTLDGHNKIMELNRSTSAEVSAYNSVNNKESGTVEFWMRTTNTAYENVFDIKYDGTYGAIFGITGGNFFYYDGGSHSIVSANNNQWYHIRIEFECSTNGYYGLSADTFMVYIDGLEYGAYNFFNNINYGNRINFRAYTGSGFKYYVDAIDYSWSSGYYINRNLIDANYELNISSNLNIEYSGNSFDNLEYLEFEYSGYSNHTIDVDLYMYNEIYKDYILIDSNTFDDSIQSFNYIFDLNYTYYSRIGIVDFIFYINYYNNFSFNIDKLTLSAIFSNYTITNNGYHTIESSYSRELLDTTLKGYNNISVDLYKTNMSISYLEHNVDGSDNYSMNYFIDFSNEIDEIIEFELQTHIRFGLNTLDIEIVNIYYLILINYNFTYEIYQQIWNGNQNAKYFKQSFSYTCNNFLRNNYTGIYGNYSYSCLRGCRVLKGSENLVYNRYFTVPYFDEKITLSSNTNVLSSGSLPSEPSPPTSTYWTYQSYRLTSGSTIQFTIGNWTVDFEQIQPESYTAKYYYRSKSVKRSDLGQWKFKITDDFKVSFNFLRNAICDILNLILVFFQFMLFLTSASLNFIFVFLGTYIIAILWNYAVYYLFYALVYVIWIFYYGLIMLLVGLYWIYEYVIIPFLRWCRDVLLPIVVDAAILWIAIGLSWLLYFITLGQIDRLETQQLIYDILWLLVIELYNWILTFISNIIYILLFVLWYILCVLYLYLRYLIARGRGFKENAERYYYTLTFFLIPIRIIINWIKDILGITPYF